MILVRYHSFTIFTINILESKQAYDINSDIQTFIHDDTANLRVKYPLKLSEQVLARIPVPLSVFLPPQDVRQRYLHRVVAPSVWSTRPNLEDACLEEYTYFDSNPIKNITIDIN